MTSVLMLLSKSFARDTRVNREALALVQSGFDVRVVSWSRLPGKIKSSREHGKIDVLYTGPACNERDFISFIINLPRFWLRAIRTGLRSNANVIHAHDFDTLPAGILLSKLRNAKIVYDAHESYADMISDDSPRIVTFVVRYIESLLMGHVDSIIASNPKVAERIGAANATIVMNCPSPSEFGSSLKAADRFAPPLRLGYFGSLEPGRFIIEAMNVISKSTEWEMVIAGDGTLLPEVERTAARCKNIAYLGVLPHNRALEESSKCAALLVMFEPSNYNNVIGAPNRLFESFFLGVPPIVTKGTLSAEIVEKEDCGFVCAYNDAEFSSLLRALAREPASMRIAGERGRAAFLREYNWEAQASRLKELYATVSCNKT